MPDVTRRDCLRAMGIAGGGMLAPGVLGGAERGAPRPNIVFVYTDDQPLSEFNCYGGKVLSPHIDRLAREGLVFDRFYISSAVCSPSRYSSLTGRYASRSLKQQQRFPAGGHVNIGWEAGIYGEAGSLPEILRDAGYLTGMVGKWMQGVSKRLRNVPRDASGREPEVAGVLTENYQRTVDSVKACGFDWADGVFMANVGAPTGPQSRGDSWLPAGMRVHNQEWVTDAALRFLDEAGERGKPFFLYMPTTLTHGPSPTASLKGDPLISPAGFLREPCACQPSRADVLRRVREAGVPESLAGVTWLDDAVGAVLARLEELGAADNTIIILASDNGKKGKFTCYDAGARMPMIIRWPAGGIRGRCASLVSNTDIAPTLYAAAGVAVPEGTTVDGVSFLPLLTGDGGYRRPHLFLEVTCERAVVSEDGYKYLAVRFAPEIQRKVDAGGRHSHWALPMDENVHHTYNAEKHFPAYFDSDQLYDLRSDPDEQTNLIGDPAQAGRIADLRSVLTSYSAGLPHRFGEFSPAGAGKAEGDADVR